MKIILDTNFLVDSIRWKIDWGELRGHELFVLDSNVEELKRIAKRGTKESSLAKVALEVLKTKGLKILESKEKETDLSLLEYSKKGYVIATQDMVLKNRIKSETGKVIYIRQKKYIEID